MSAIALPRPDNLRTRFGDMVEADVFHICERIRELDPNLYVYVIEGPNDSIIYTIAEMCVDGVERLVFRTKSLDARVIERLQFLLHVPFEQRFAEAERIESEREAKRKEDEHAKLYEQVGRPMWTDLERCGFMQRSVSYPKRGVTSPGRR